MTYASVEVVEVRAWDRTVGAVTLDPATGFYAFEYAPEWLDERIELAPIHMPARPGVFSFPALARTTFLGLPPLLADALPDRFGNALIDAWMATRGIGADQIIPLDRLAYAADRAMGSLEFRPPRDVPADDLVAVQLADLVTAARSALRGDLTAGPDAEAALQQLIQVGTSAGGARAKAVIAFNPDTGQIRSGQLSAPDGFEHWLVKLDGVGTDPTREETLGAASGYGVIEYAYHLMATAAGVEMAECRLLPEGDRTHFMTRRFDRGPGGVRHHLLSLCGLAHLDFNLAGAHSYDQYLATVAHLDLGGDALEQAFRRVVFNVASVNRDDHTKNLAFLLPEHGRWQLAPAFDVTYAHNPAGAWTRTHQMTVNGKGEDITVDDLHATADRWGVPGYRDVVGDVLHAVDRWRDHAAEAGLDDSHTDPIAQALQQHQPR